MDKETREFLENKFGIVEQRLTAIDGRLDTMDGRFTRIDGRLDTMDGRFTRIDEQFTSIDGKFEETKRYFGVLAEGLRSEIRQVAEGHQILVDGQARIVEKIEHTERELGAMIKFSYAELDRRIRTVEEKMLALETRVERIETGHA